jgi:hypothetical protein
VISFFGGELASLDLAHRSGGAVAHDEDVLRPCSNVRNPEDGANIPIAALT